MPELPEVETIKRDLEKIVLGKKIIEACVHQPLVVREPSVAAFKRGLAGAQIKQILRRGKLLIFELSTGKALTIHLKLTGQLVFPGGGKQSRVVFYLAGGKALDFNDQRLFGELRLVDDWRDLKFVRNLGPEPFDLTFAHFAQMLSGRKTKIKTLLLDQEFISGIGNIYAAEILFWAKIHPERPAQSLTAAEAKKLFQKTKSVLHEAIRLGGSSVADYVRLSGARGTYGKRHQVYGREGKPCFICRQPIKRTVQGGRGTYFCARCQY